MSAHVLLNLLNELGKREKMLGKPRILSLFPNNNPSPDLVNVNAYIKLGKKLEICSHGIERKQNWRKSMETILIQIREKGHATTQI